MLVFLWTDILLFVLMGFVAAYVVYARRREHLRAPWRQVVRSRTAMAAAVVLSWFVAVALLDSWHFRPSLDGESMGIGPRTHSADIVSVFDLLVRPLREHTEKTYSAPFATRLYAKEPVDLAGGKGIYGYPRLTHGGRHLTDPASQKADDILRTSSAALVEAMLYWALLCLAVVWCRARAVGASLGRSASDVVRGNLATPWRTLLLTAGVLIVLALLAARLGVKYHLMGTDKVGQDVFYQALKSIRVGLIIGTLSTLVMLPFALALGVMAGYFRGWVDDVVQYLYTTLNSIPSPLLIAATILMMQVYLANHPESYASVAERADLRLLFLCVVLGVTSWTGLCRLLRGEVLKTREADYIQAAAALGVFPITVMVRHIVPNVMHIVLITVVLDFSTLVLAEAVLSYINIGVDPSSISWGNMINSARLEMAREPIVWWSLAAALLFMFALVLSANLFSDAVRDAFDPRLELKNSPP